VGIQHHYGIGFQDAVAQLGIFAGEVLVLRFQVKVGLDVGRGFEDIGGHGIGGVNDAGPLVIIVPNDEIDAERFQQKK
jgi:hypothetical protein